MKKKKENKKITLSMIILSIILWIMIFIKLLVFDIDIYLVNKIFPSLTNLFNFKFLGVLVFICFILLFYRQKFKFVVPYIIFFPIICICFYLPYYIFKRRSSILFIIVLNSILLFFTNFKKGILITTSFILSCIFVLEYSSKSLLITSIIVVFNIIVICYWMIFSSVFKESKIQKYYLILINRFDISNLKLQSEKTINRPFELLNENEKVVRNNDLQIVVLINRICLFASHELQKYQRSRLNIVSYCFAVILLAIFTVFSFALVNYGVYKLEANMYTSTEKPSLFLFIYYSFNNLLSHPITELSPISNLTRSLSMIETLFGFILVVILVTVIFSFKREKFTDELNVSIRRFERIGEDLERIIQKKFKLNNIEEALIELEKVKVAFIKLIFLLSEKIKR